jgi:hypothetical protein
MTLKNRLLAILPLVVLGFSTTFATATEITGDFGMGGSATVSAVSLDFFCSLGGCPGTSGDFIVSPIAATGSFAGLGNSRGFVQDISQTGGQPLNTPFSLAQWISFLAAPSLFLDLQFIPLGQGTPSATCAGINFCTPIVGAPLISGTNPLGLSAFNLTPGSASFEVRGIGYTGSSATGYSTFVGRFSADFPNLSTAQIVTLFNDPGIVNKAYSAAFVLSVVPEPSNRMLMLGAVLAMVSVSLRRYLRRRGTVQ